MGLLIYFAEYSVVLLTWETHDLCSEKLYCIIPSSPFPLFSLFFCSTFWDIKLYLPALVLSFKFLYVLKALYFLFFESSNFVS